MHGIFFLWLKYKWIIIYKTSVLISNIIQSTSEWAVLNNSYYSTKKFTLGNIARKYVNALQRKNNSNFREKRNKRSASEKHSIPITKPFFIVEAEKAFADDIAKVIGIYHDVF